jgi:hypothetical protein
MNNFALPIKRALLASLCFAPGLSLAFNSGSTGADGAFNPSVNTVLQLPESGVFNFTTVNIPSGVTVTFKKNTTNTPVVMLASGDVTVAGMLNLVGIDSPPVGAAGDGNIGDDGVQGIGGPGGYDGGRGGQTTGDRLGGAGLGPGGGTGGNVSNSGLSYRVLGGAGGGFGGAGACNRACQTWGNNTYGILSSGGAAYGSNLLLPLIGGSGGGGGGGGTAFSGSGGGGGGGAILIASSGTVAVTGTIYAYGGTSGAAAGAGAGGTGGAGSGGAIRIVATTIAGNGAINADGRGVGSNANDSYANGGSGAVGRVRLEAETITRTAGTTPAYTTGAPGQLFIAGAPTLTISSVAGVAAPATPTGNADITLPANTPNPVTVVLKTTGVPVGNTVQLTVTPAIGAPVVVVSPALTGTTDNATVSISVNLPSGPSVLSATTTYTIVAALGDAMSTYAQGERVEKIALTTKLGGKTQATLITVSGKKFNAPAAALSIAGMTG